MTKFKQDAPMRRCTVRMTEQHARRAKKIGKGSMGEGVRIAIEFYDDAERIGIAGKISDKKIAEILSAIREILQKS